MVSRLELTVTLLSLTSPLHGDKYSLTTYTSRPGDSSKLSTHSTKYTFTELKVNVPVSLAITSQLSDVNTNIFNINFNLFTCQTLPDEANTPELLLMASAYMPYGCKEATLVLYDTQKDEEAKLHVQCKYTPEVKDACQAHSKHRGEIVRKCHEIIEEAAQTNEGETETVLLYVKASNDLNIPILDFLCATDLSMAESEEYRQELTRLFSWYYDLACAHVHEKNVRFGSFSDDKKAVVVSEMLTMLSRAIMYRADQTRKNGCSTVLTEQFVQLLSFPSLGRAVADCEDMTIVCYQMCMLLKHRLHLDDEASQDLHDVQEFVRKRTACFIFGSLLGDRNEEDEGEPKHYGHAYMGLFNTRFLASDGVFDHDDDDAARAVVIIESTARLNGLASSTQPLHGVKGREIERVYELLSEKLDSKSLFNLLLKYESSIPDATSKQLYGPIYSLITTDWTSDGGDGIKRIGNEWHVMKSENKRETIVGRDGMQVLAPTQNNIRLQRIRTVQMGDKATTELTADVPLCDAPRFTCLSDDTRSTILDQAMGDFRVDFHNESFKTHEVKITEALRALDAYNHTIIQDIPLVNGLCITQVWFVRKAA
jgi:hypothetical protein